MKRFDFLLDEHQVAWMFAPLRTKSDVILLLMKTMKIMLVPTPPPKGLQVASLILIVSKMSRLIYFSPRKIFSINFPFFVSQEEDTLRFWSNHHPDIGSKCTSDVLGFLNSQEMLSTSEILAFAEPIIDAADYDRDIWLFFRELMLWEDGYVRYDHDEERSDGHRHPLHHLDIFYTSAATFKLGVKSTITPEYLSDILDINSDCHYVNPP